MKQMSSLALGASCNGDCFPSRVRGEVGNVSIDSRKLWLDGGMNLTLHTVVSCMGSMCFKFSKIP